MSFKCDYCSEPQDNGVKPNRIVVETRNVTYSLKNGETSSGTEIVKEVDLCVGCKGNTEPALQNLVSG